MINKHLNKRGFTLVELLIVVSIVTLLAALLFPVAKSARDSVRTSSCATNLSQLGKAMAMYVSDHANRYPPPFIGDGCSWADSIYPYVKSTKVFSCPTAQHSEYIPGCFVGSHMPPGMTPIPFGNNGNYDMVSPLVQSQTTVTVNGTVGSTNTKMDIQQKGLSALRYRFPASTILLLDGTDTTLMLHNQFAVMNPGVDPIHSVDDLKDGGVLPVHRDGVNLLYVDGHVKWQNLQSLASTPMWRPDGKEPTDMPTPVPTP